MYNNTDYIWCSNTVLHCPLQYSTVQYGTVCHSTWSVRYSTVQYSTVRYSTVKYGTVQYSTVLYDIVNPMPLYELRTIHFDSFELSCCPFQCWNEYIFWDESNIDYLSDENWANRISNIIHSSRKYSNIIRIPENIRIFEYIQINLQKNVKVLESKIFTGCPTKNYIIPCLGGL